MNSETYKLLRTRIGSQADVAALLDVHVATIAHREQGTVRIRREAMYALERLAQREGAVPTPRATRLKPRDRRKR